MEKFNDVNNILTGQPKTWFVTGVAGFIGSNLLEHLLKLDQNVTGIDNFSTGHRRNLDEVRSIVTTEQWSRFRLIEGDIRNISDCHNGCQGVNYVLHQAALGSVPRSMNDPITTNDVNVGGFLNMLVASRDANVDSFTYAASSSTYGDHQSLPKVEEIIGRPLSPYAVTKYVNELYAQVFHSSFGLKCTGLRYFNVFGKRQDPNGAYAAVIPQWVGAMMHDQPVYINGAGDTSRDFCYIDNVIQANILSAINVANEEAWVFNVAYGEATSLNELYQLISNYLSDLNIAVQRKPIYRDYRNGDVKHSLADITKAKTFIEYHPTYDIKVGLKQSIKWYVQNTSLIENKI